MIFNALIIVALVPLALRGVRYRPQSAAQMLRRNLLIYGVGGISPRSPHLAYRPVVSHAPPCLEDLVMLRQLAPAFRIVLLLTFITGVVYPLLVTGVCQLIFPKQANGSLIAANGRVIGSELIGQEAGSSRYFHSRPSAAGTGYDANQFRPSNHTTSPPVLPAWLRLRIAVRIPFARQIPRPPLAGWAIADLDAERR